MEPSPQHELELLLRARMRLVAIETTEESRVREVVLKAARAEGRPVHRWTLSQGLLIAGAGPQERTREPLDALRAAATLPDGAVVHFEDLGPFLDKPEVVRALKDATESTRGARRTFIVSGHDLPLGRDLSARAARVKWTLPGPRELESLMGRVLAELSRTLDVQVQLSPEALARLLRSLEGLTLDEAQSTLARAVADDHALTSDDIERVHEMKRAILGDAGALELIAGGPGLEDVAGLDALQDWLKKRRRGLEPQAKAFGIPAPRGVLLLGVQGCGKSFIARALAKDWGLPLVRLEPGRLYDKYIGESERRLDRALAAVERMAPAVLWIDEIEKGVATGADSAADGGLGMRLAGRLLTWLQERTAPVFVVATANDVRRLPPELMRKGRFDEVFFVDLPTPAERKRILAIHVAQRGRDPNAFALAAVAEATDGFSGAELEQVVVSALYTAFAADGELDDASLLAEAKATQPLSRVRAEEVNALRAWAHGRTVPAGASHAAFD